MTGADASSVIRPSPKGSWRWTTALAGVKGDPASADEDATVEGKIPWDLAVVECVGKDLKRVVEPVKRVSGVTEGDPPNDPRPRLG
jgi:hypothetical protein